MYSISDDNNFETEPLPMFTATPGAHFIHTFSYSLCYVHAYVFCWPRVVKLHLESKKGDTYYCS